MNNGQLTNKRIAVYQRAELPEARQAQLESNLEFVGRAGGNPSRALVFDDISKARPQLARVLEKVEAREVDAVVVNDLSRLTRSYEDMEATLRTLARCGVALHVVTDSHGKASERE